MLFRMPGIWSVVQLTSFVYSFNEKAQKPAKMSIGKTAEAYLSMHTGEKSVNEL